MISNSPIYPCPCMILRKRITNLETGRIRTCFLPCLSAFTIVFRQSASTFIFTIPLSPQIILIIYSHQISSILFGTSYFNYMSTLQIRVCGRFRLEDKIYEGKNSSVYTGKNVQSDRSCAIKCEVKSMSPSFVMNQGNTLEVLQGGIGIPHLMWYGENGDFQFLVTELLGNSLEEYLDICGGRFSLKTVFMIAEKILSSLEFIHYKNYLHRDIKPSNFVVGLGKKLHQIYVIDTAFATKYSDPQTKQHRPNQINAGKFVGTLRFASLNVLQGNRNSRRDDLESLGLMLVYFLKGQLPWSLTGGQTVKQKLANIRRIHQQTSVEQLCDGLPKQFNDYLTYCRSLKYQQIPDYTLLRRMFKQRFIRQGYQFDYIYDWILIPLKLKNTDLSNRVPLNRFIKKEDPSLSMKNYEWDFTPDFELKSKQTEEDKQTTEIKAVQDQPRRTKRSESELPRNQRKSRAPKKANEKDECTIF